MSPLHQYTLVVGLIALASASAPTKEIAPGVHLPLILLGGVNATTWPEWQHESNYSMWLQLGERGFDSAWEYGTHAAMGRAIRASSVPRSEIFISTKIQCSIHNGASAHGKHYPAHATREGARAMIRDNLRELGTDYIDVLLIHTPCDAFAPYAYNASAQTAIVWEVLEEAVANGTVKAIGVSQFRKEHLEPLLKTARIIPAINQYPTSVGYTDWETVEFCQQHNITIQAFSPLHTAQCDGGPASSSPTMQRIAGAHNMSTYQLTLRWLTQRGFGEVTATTKSSHAVSDLQSFNYTLTKEEMDTLDRCAGKVKDVMPTVMV